MSYHCDFLPESQTIVVRWNDVLTAESFIDFLSVLVAHPDFRSNMNRLYDFRSATIELTTTGLRSIKSEIQDLDEAHGDRRVAFLVHRDLAYGMMRMFTAIAALLSVIPTWFKFKVPDEAVEPPGMDASEAVPSGDPGE